MNSAGLRICESGWMRKGIEVRLGQGDRERLEAVIGSGNSLQKHVWRARIVLLIADGVGTCSGSGPRMASRCTGSHSFKLSNDPKFCDARRTAGREESQIKALDRTQPGLPMKKGRFRTMTLHPQHIGWSNRLQLLDEFLAELRGYPSLWNPTATECARYWLETFPAGTHLRPEPSIW